MFAATCAVSIPLDSLYVFAYEHVSFSSERTEHFRNVTKLYAVQVPPSDRLWREGAFMLSVIYVEAGVDVISTLSIPRFEYLFGSSLHYCALKFPRSRAHPPSYPNPTHAAPDLSKDMDGDEAIYKVYLIFTIKLITDNHDAHATHILFAACEEAKTQISAQVVNISTKNTCTT